MAKQATDDNIIWCRKDAMAMPDDEGKNIDTHL